MPPTENEEEQRRTRRRRQLRGFAPPCLTLDVRSEVNISLNSIFKTSSPLVRSSVYRYGILVLAVALLVHWGFWLNGLRSDYPYDRYSNGVVALMILLNHLAVAFEWRKSVSFLVRLAALSWLAFGMFYVVYWSHVLFPK